MAGEGQVEQERWDRKPCVGRGLGGNCRVDERKEEAGGRSSGCRNVSSFSNVHGSF